MAFGIGVLAFVGLLENTSIVGVLSYASYLLDRLFGMDKGSLNVVTRE